ncbi:MAG: hypothetical protein V4747_11520 [Pseudomonadota bacterium]
MAISVTHQTEAVGTPAGDGEIAAVEWNEPHVVEMATGKILGRTSASDGAVEEITAGSGLVLSAGELAMDTHVTGRNRLINGAMVIAQRGTSFTSATTPANNDDAYTLDRWYILSDGNDVVDVTQETSVVPTNGYRAIALDVETVNKKFGIAQIIEQANCIGMIGGEVTLSFKAKVSATTKLDNVKAAIIAWSGTADTVTSDIISAWGAEGTAPTLIADATYENTPANLGLTTSYATYRVTATVDTASTKNIIVMIWSDVTDTTLGDFLYITDVQLEVGTVVTPVFEHLRVAQDLINCQRYTYALDGNGRRMGNSFNKTTTVAEMYVIFPVTMRTGATLTAVGAGSDYAIAYLNTAQACSVVPALATSSPFGTTINLTVASGLTAGQASNGFLNSNTGRLILSSEL